jgi:lysophospholipid acyltransferase (LPLAT)-like uncharacterized protein
VKFMLEEKSFTEPLPIAEEEGGRSGLLMSLTARIAAAAIRLVGRSLRYRFVVDDLDAVPQRRQSPAIYVFWHEMLLLPIYTHSRQIMPLVSRSSEGELVDEVLKRFGGKTIRGSTDHGGRNRGGRTALREMLRQGAHRHLGLPIDGPVGHPRHIASRGVAWVAAHGHMPVIPVGIAATTLKTFGRRDRRLTVPLMFGKACFVVGKPIRAPVNLRRSEARAFIQEVQGALEEVQARAESYVHNGHRPASSLTLKDLRALESAPLPAA